MTSRLRQDKGEVVRHTTHTWTYYKSPKKIHRDKVQLRHISRIITPKSFPQMISTLAIPFSLSFINHREHKKKDRDDRMLEKLHFNKSALPLTTEPAVTNDQADKERQDKREIPRISSLW